MIKRLLLIDEMDKSLNNGIVCFKVTQDNGGESHFFFTKSSELIEFFNDDCGISLHTNEAFDILNKKTLELEASSFEGEVYSIGHCYLPSDDIELKDVKIYLGNKTGAVVISESMLKKFSDSSLEDFGIKEDDKSMIITGCLGINGDVLEDIYLVNDEGVHV